MRREIGWQRTVQLQVSCYTVYAHIFVNLATIYTEAYIMHLKTEGAKMNQSTMHAVAPIRDVIQFLKVDKT